MLQIDSQSSQLSFSHRYITDMEVYGIGHRPDPDLKSDRCIIDYKTTNLNTERRRCEIWLGGPGHAPLENFVLMNARSCIFLHSDV